MTRERSIIHGYQESSGLKKAVQAVEAFEAFGQAVQAFRKGRREGESRRACGCIQLGVLIIGGGRLS
jgi:hypothetical protein